MSISLKNFSYKRIAYHFFFWLAYISVILIVYVGLYNSEFKQILIQTLRLLPFIMVSAYIVLYILIPRLLFQKKIIIFIVLFILIPLLIISIYHYIVYFNFNKTHPERSTPYFNFGFLFAQFEAFLVISIASAIKIIKTWYETQHKQVLLEKQSLKSELEILRYQINPHFLFNVLNNLFSLAHQNNDNVTASGIAKLSDMMRYMIYDSKPDRIFLKKEIQHIRNYIDLQKIRFTEGFDTDIQLKITGEPDVKLVAPLLFIPFVENAFKYGITIHSKSFIHIKIDIKNTFVEFSIKNSIKKITKDNSGLDSGIGLVNVRRRLELLYPDKHELTLQKNNNNFNVHLKIGLA